MIKIIGESVTRIDRDVGSISIPQAANCIGCFACFNGSLVSLDLKDSNIKIIEKYAFANCTMLRNTTFPSCLEIICEGSFQNCVMLANITFDINPKLREIGQKAFRRCQILENFEFPRCLTSIGDRAFEKCDRMKIFDLRDTSIKSIENFIGYNENVSIYLPSTVISNNLFLSINSEKGHPAIRSDRCGYCVFNRRIYQGNKILKHILIRRGTEMISYGCFRGSSLVSVTIPASVTIISKSSFESCNKLEQIHFAKNSKLRAIKYLAFYNCTKIKKVVFPKSPKALGFIAFEKCESLEKVIVQKDSQLEKIKESFQKTNIRHLVLPQSIKKIEGICREMHKLESIYVNNDLYKSNSEGTAIFSTDGFDLVATIRRLKHFEIPDCVRTIKRSAFETSEISGQLNFPYSVEIIEDNAFLFCSSLMIIKFQPGSKLKSIGINTFYELIDLIINNEHFIKRSDGVVMSCNPPGIVFVPSHLTKLEVDYGIEFIHSFSFYRSKIKSIRFPSSLKKIGMYAFNDRELISITFEEGTELEFVDILKAKHLKISNYH